MRFLELVWRKIIRTHDSAIPTKTAIKNDISPDILRM